MVRGGLLFPWEVCNPNSHKFLCISQELDCYKQSTMTIITLSIFGKKNLLLSYSNETVHERKKKWTLCCSLSCNLKTTLNIVFIFTNFVCFACVVLPTQNANLTLFVIPYNFFGQCRFTTLQILALTKWFSFEFQSSMTIFYYIIVKMHNYTKVRFNNWHGFHSNFNHPCQC